MVTTLLKKPEQLCVYNIGKDSDVDLSGCNATNLVGILRILDLHQNDLDKEFLNMYYIKISDYFPNSTKNSIDSHPELVKNSLDYFVQKTIKDGSTLYNFPKNGFWKAKKLFSAHLFIFYSMGISSETISLYKIPISELNKRRSKIFLADKSEQVEKLLINIYGDSMSYLLQDKGFINY